MIYIFFLQRRFEKIQNMLAQEVTSSKSMQVITSRLRHNVELDTCELIRNMLIQIKKTWLLLMVIEIKTACRAPNIFSSKMMNLVNEMTKKADLDS